MATNATTFFGVRQLASAFVGGLFGAVASLYTPTNPLLISLSAILGSIALLVVASAVNKHSRLVVTVFNILLVLLFVTAVAGIWYVVLADEKERYSSLFTTTDGVRLRNAAALDGGVSARLSAGTEVFQLDRSWRRFRFRGPRGTSLDYWRYVRTRDGREGWAYGAFLDVRPPRRQQHVEQGRQ